jgi:hypothetical protein
MLRLGDASILRSTGIAGEGLMSPAPGEFLLRLGDKPPNNHLAVDELARG